MVAHVARRRAQRDNFGVGRRVTIGDVAVAGCGDHAIFDDDDSAHGHFAPIGGVSGLRQRQAHGLSLAHPPAAKNAGTAYSTRTTSRSRAPWRACAWYVPTTCQPVAWQRRRPSWL